MGRKSPALERHIDELYPELDALFRAGEAVERIQRTEGWEAISAVLSAEVDAIDAQMQGSATALSQADYAVRHGRIGGLRAAAGAADAIVELANRRRAEQQSRHETAAESVVEG